MKLLIDMNLSSDWVATLKENGWEAVHWRSIGDPRAQDAVIMDYARSNGHIVLTHDLDFGALLAATQTQGPSVVQVRTQDIMPCSLAPRMLQILRDYTEALEQGALIIVDELKSQVRLLPL